MIIGKKGSRVSSLEMLRVNPVVLSTNDVSRVPDNKTSILREMYAISLRNTQLTYMHGPLASL